MIEMEEPFNICLTCLSTDRSLVPLYKITTLLQEIFFEELQQSDGGICWECWSNLGKFYKFKKKAKMALDILSKTTELRNIKPLSTLTSKTNISFDYQYRHSIDPLIDYNTKLKTEPDAIKQEIIDEIDNIDNNSDFNEKKSSIDEETEIYDDIENTNHASTILRKEDILDKCDYAINKHRLSKKNTQHGNEIKINFAQVIFSGHNEKLSDELTEKVYVEAIENKSKHSVKTKSTRDFERVKKEFQDKFTRVVLSEEDMLKARDEKRNHYNFKKIPFKCDSCVLGFTKKDTYSLHMKKKHDENIGDQICDVCRVRFRHKIALNNHKSKHYVVYRCRLCKYEAHDFVWIVNHCKMKHLDDEPDKIHCSQCEVVVKTPGDLERHIQTEHTLFCDCGVQFKDKNNLRQHMSRAHSTLRSFICDICKKTFKTKSRLESHMVSHGNLAKKLSYCQQCNIQYKNIRVYRNHLASSSNHSQGYPCSECNKKFRSKGYLRQHYNFYHLRKSQYNCEVCNKLFISNWRLRNHKQQYHGASRPRNHSCNMCGKKFFTSSTLRSHLLTHSAQRSFMCAHCGDTFKQSAALYTHTRLRHKGVATRTNNS